jgi:hypothetical protein
VEVETPSEYGEEGATEENSAVEDLSTCATGPLASARTGAVRESVMLRARRRHNSDDGSLLNSYDYLRESGMWDPTLARRGILHDMRDDPDDPFPDASAEEGQQTSEGDTEVDSLCYSDLEEAAENDEDQLFGP